MATIQCKFSSKVNSAERHQKYVWDLGAQFMHRLLQSLKEFSEISRATCFVACSSLEIRSFSLITTLVLALFKLYSNWLQYTMGNRIQGNWSCFTTILIDFKMHCYFGLYVSHPELVEIGWNKNILHKLLLWFQFVTWCISWAQQLTLVLSPQTLEKCFLLSFLLLFHCERQLFLWPPWLKAQ